MATYPDLKIDLCPLFYELVFKIWNLIFSPLFCQLIQIWNLQFFLSFWQFIQIFNLIFFPSFAPTYFRNINSTNWNIISKIPIGKWPKFLIWSFPFMYKSILEISTLHYKCCDFDFSFGVAIESQGTYFYILIMFTQNFIQAAQNWSWCPHFGWALGFHRPLSL